MPLDPLLPHTLDLAQALEAARRPPRQLQRLAVGEQHVGRHALASRHVPAPGDEPLVAGLLRLVQLGEQAGEGRPLGLPFVVLRRGRVGVGAGHGRLAADERPRLQKDRPAGPPVVDEELRLGPQHLPPGQVGPQRLVVEQPRARLKRHGQDPDFTHRTISSTAPPQKKSEPCPLDRPGGATPGRAPLRAAGGLPASPAPRGPCGRLTGRPPLAQRPLHRPSGPLTRPICGTGEQMFSRTTCNSGSR